VPDGTDAADTTTEDRSIFPMFSHQDGLKEARGLHHIPAGLFHLTIFDANPDVAVPLDPGQVIDLDVAVY
jgi:hypothetical protein